MKNSNKKAGDKIIISRYDASIFLEALKMHDMKEMENLGIDSLDKITELDLRGVKISELPKEIGCLSNLEKLYLGEEAEWYDDDLDEWEYSNGKCRVTILPIEIGKLTNLRVLNLSHSPISSLPPTIKLLNKLKEIVLDETDFTTFPVEICFLSNLQTLSFKKARFTALPSEVGFLRNLRELYLDNSSIEIIPSEIGSLKNLLGVSLCYSRIGFLPSEIGQLSKLERLYLTGTKIRMIPAEIGHLKGLKSLSLSFTEISSLPSEIGQLVSLQELYLSGTEISNLPLQIGQLTNLRALYLNESHISSIPDELSNLTGLEIIDLSHLKLDGIPKWLVLSGIPFVVEKHPVNLSSYIHLYNTELRTQPVDLFLKGFKSIHSFFIEQEKKLSENKMYGTEEITTSILHLSDLHFTRNPSVSNMRDTVLEEVRDHVREKPLGKKLLVITGDFHNFWTKDYSDAISFINELIEAMGIDRKEDVFIIPGNHDVANDSLMDALFKETVPEWKKQKEESIAGIREGNYSYIDVCINSYVSYCQFAREIGIYPKVADQTTDTTPARVHFRRWRGKLNVLHLNTTLVYTPGIKEDQMLDFIQANNSKLWKQYYNEVIPTIVLGHNSFYDLRKEERTTLQGRFGLKKVSAYLCGDTHLKEEDPDKLSITVKVSGYTQTIPNIVCAKGVADLSDNYSDFGFYWHEWDETSDKVTVTFRRWRDVYLGTTAHDGPDRYYTMKRQKQIKPDVILPKGKWNYKVLIMDDNLEQLNFLYQELVDTFSDNSPYYVSVHKATTPNEVLHMNMDADFDVFILDVARNPELTSQVRQYQDFGLDLVKRMLKERPNIKVKAKFVIYSRLKIETIWEEFGGLNNDLNIEFIQKRISSVSDVASVVKNHFDYLFHRDIDNL